LGNGSTNSGGYLNDLWKFDGNNWTWMSGSNIANQASDYGTKGTPAVTNMPGGRTSAVTWIDRGGNLLLFGGDVYDPARMGTLFNDLWLYKP